MKLMEVRATLCTNSESAFWDKHRNSTEEWDGFHVGFRVMLNCILWLLASVQ